MSWWRRVIPRQRQRTPEPADQQQELPEVEPWGWYVHLEEANSASVLTMLRRLPFLVGRALAIAWRASWSATLLSIGLNAVAGVGTTLVLLATRDVAESVFGAGPTWDRLAEAVPSLIVLAVATAARASLGIGAGYAQGKLKPLVTNVVEAQFFALTTAVELAAYDDDAFADEIQRSRDRGMAAAVSLVEYTIDVITGVIGVVAVAAAVVVIHPVLLPLLVLAVVPIGWAAVAAARIQYKSFQTRITRRRRLWLLEDLMASRRTAAEVRAYDMAGWLRGQHKAMVASETGADMSVLAKQTTTRIWGGLAGGLATFAVYAVLVWLLAIGEVPLAGGAAAVLALQQGGTSMRLLLTSVNSLYDEGLYFSDHIQFIDKTTAALPPAAPPTPEPAVAPPTVIRFDRVSLRYPDTDTDAVHNVSLEIRHGETVALVGENGSGKSSLAKLIACLYPPTHGTITWDGTDIAGTDPHQLRRHLGVVVQDFQHFPFAARANIGIGRATHTFHDPDIKTAAQAAGAHDMITALPLGYDTLLDKMYRGGVELSGGQWQRMAAARGFYRDSPILICDEPSAALDPRAEAQLFSYLKDRAGNATTILITHRLANIRHADRIIVLDKGQLIETGTHDQLMANAGTYSTLFDLQASGYIADTNMQTG